MKPIQLKNIQRDTSNIKSKNKTISRSAIDDDAVVGMAFLPNAIDCYESPGVSRLNPALCSNLNGAFPDKTAFMVVTNASNADAYFAQAFRNQDAKYGIDVTQNALGSSLGYYSVTRNESAPPGVYHQASTIICRNNITNSSVAIVNYFNQGNAGSFFECDSGAPIQLMPPPYAWPILPVNLSQWVAPSPKPALTSGATITHLNSNFPLLTLLPLVLAVYRSWK